MPIQMLARIGVLGGLGAVLTFYAAFKLPVFPTFLKIDPGDLTAFLSTLTMGTSAGLWTEVVKVALHFLIRGGNVLGHAANLLAGASAVIGTGLVYRHDGGRLRSVSALAAGVAAVVLVMVPANALFFLPARGITGAAAWAMSIQVLAPFNLVKFGISGSLAYVLSTRVHAWTLRGSGDRWQSRGSTGRG